MLIQIRLTTSIHRKIHRRFTKTLLGYHPHTAVLRSNILEIRCLHRRLVWWRPNKKLKEETWTKWKSMFFRPFSYLCIQNTLMGYDVETSKPRFCSCKPISHPTWGLWHCHTDSFCYKCSFVITEEWKPTRCHLSFYCASYRLNMFRALLCPSSGPHDYNVNYHIGRFVLGLLQVGG